MTARLGVYRGFILALLTSVMIAQARKPRVISAEDLKRIVPTAYFFRVQSASVQLRNSVGFSSSDGKLVLAGLVDTSGYAADVQAKYQGFLITEVKLNVEGTELAPGQYGFGFSKANKFLVMDVGANDVLSVSAKLEDRLAHPVPLKIVEDGGGYRLYAGRKWVTLKAQ